ncbi:hypothetical protein QLS71_008240 [Mariniflexile litorale]|uniref:DUF7793 domain-containing protein n=1 Tax=Mariniflexile litorale TaxID=3045158 RepID=A0AAU7EKU8_9FLAO|nr:hypothetical protein [Mariniflexile sp. KMM 9835]MDQ8212778.1 hypothetical protein [Mariniflexile sp. KMM 9835]
MNTINKVIKLNKAKFWTNSLGIIFCEFNNTETFLTLEVDTVERYEKAISTLSQGKPMPFLIDIRNNQGNFSTQAAKLFANSLVFEKIRVSEAFVINSINTKLLINTYKRIYEPNTPFKIFHDFDEALTYLINVKKTFDGEN